MKKLLALTLAVVMILTVSAAFAKTLTTDEDCYEGLPGVVVNATVGEYNTLQKTFTVTMYADDCFDIEDVAKLAAGDTLVAGQNVYTVKEIKTTDNDEVMAVTEDGTEIIFVQVGDDHAIAQSTDDDHRFMHAIAVLRLPAAEGIIYEDNSDPEKDEPVVTKGLEEILKIKEEKEKTSIGFDFYATIIELNDKMEIVRIHQDYDVAQ